MASSTDDTTAMGTATRPPAGPDQVADALAAIGQALATVVGVPAWTLGEMRSSSAWARP
ncbi:MAG: hypothetical protein QOI06_2592 [Nocardioidaceae bacterium]|jgi:hypothetical protein|nr:hypothetical protein [Nocardioidaceae bacterium]